MTKNSTEDSSVQLCVCVCVLFRLRDGEDVRMMWISCLIPNGKFVWQFNRRVPEM